LGVLPGEAGQHTQNVEVFPLKPEEHYLFAPNGDGLS
jgi:hypothetical protein